MSVRSIEAEVSIKSGVQAECTIGREVPYYIDRPIYDGQTEVYPSDSDIVLPTAGLAVESDILIHAIQKPENICEGEFIGTEDGVLRVNIPYSGNDFPKMIVIYVKDDICSINGEFFTNANLNAINVAQILKMSAGIPTFDKNTNANFARYTLLYKSSNTGYNQSALSGYAYNQGVCKWNADCVKLRDNKTIDVFIKTERDPETGGFFFMKNVRYTYQVFY